MDVDKLLAKRGLKFEDLEPEEQETLNTWLGALNKSQVNVQSIREYVGKMRESVGNALTAIDDVPNDWLSLMGLFIPFIGIIRKWYLDQKRLGLQARLRNYILLEAMLSTPAKAKAEIEKQIAGITSGKSR